MGLLAYQPRGVYEPLAALSAYFSRWCEPSGAGLIRDAIAAAEARLPREFTV
jgi:hypothetical protein